MGKKFGVYNEWGKLREVFVGIAPDNMVEPEYIPAFAWMNKEGIDYCKKFGGQKSIKVLPDMIKVLKKQIAGHVKALKDHGVKVYRNRDLRYNEERGYLDHVQKGYVVSGGADFFRVIGNNIILLTNLRYPFRRKQVYTIRPVLEPLIKNSNLRYAAPPPPSPHYSKDDLYLENGDIMADGYNIYVGMSGLATSPKGVAWLKQFLGPKYKIHVIKLAPTVLHLDTVLTLNRPGLLTYYPELVKELPKPLKRWDKIKVYRREGEGETFGANHLSLDEKTIIVSKEYSYVGDEFRKKGMRVISLPLGVSMAYGSGARCLTGVLRRDP